MQRSKLRRRPQLSWKVSGGELSPEQLLEVHWRAFPPEQLKVYLVRLITRECQARPRRAGAIVPPGHPHLQPRLRRRRISVAKAVKYHGVKVRATGRWVGRFQYGTGGRKLGISMAPSATATSKVCSAATGHNQPFASDHCWISLPPLNARLIAKNQGAGIGR